MTLRAGNKRTRSAEHPGSCGFTLIELILVMAILIIVLSVTAPTLTSFFRSRTLDSEARRFLALTHYAQSRAVSEGVPISLWIDSQERKYGLEIEVGYSETDDKASEYTLGRDLEIELSALSTATTTRPVTARNEQRIRFTSDGFIGEANPEAIIIRQGESDTVWIAPNRNRLSYEITTNNLQTTRR
jgi:type II secretion system protein H